MAQVTGIHGFGAAICDALGLKRVLRLQLDLGPNHASVVATVAVQADGYEELASVIRRFDLHPVEKPVDAPEVDDAQADAHDAA